MGFGDGGADVTFDTERECMTLLLYCTYIMHGRALKIISYDNMLINGTRGCADVAATED